MKHIFIVDDDIHIGNMLEEVLQREGYKVSRAYSGTEALLVLSTQTPDLILLDLMLPGLNGEEVLPKIQGIPVIILSARSETDHKVQFLTVRATTSRNLSTSRSYWRGLPFSFEILPRTLLCVTYSHFRKSN